MTEIYQHFETLFDDRVRLPALYVGDESNSAGFVFEIGAVQAVGRKTGRVVLVIAAAHLVYLESPVWGM
jgi:hypothetical protein